MRKYAALFIVLVLGITIAFLAVADTDETAVAEPEAIDTDQAVAPERPGESLPEGPEATPTSGTCPSTHACVGGTTTCGGNNPCKKSMFASGSQDTGLQSCTGGGGPLHCPPGQTVHVLTFNCSQCPCCSGQPNACLCPNDCGTATELACM